MLYVRGVELHFISLGFLLMHIYSTSSLYCAWLFHDSTATTALDCFHTSNVIASELLVVNEGPKMCQCTYGITWPYFHLFEWIL